MAQATFILEDTKEVRSELSLLLQIESSQLDKISHNGLLTVEFPSLLEDKALHVLSTAVANHGFQVSINHTPVSRPEVVKKTSTPTTVSLDSKTIARVEASGKTKTQGNK